jgi:PBP superfamily domain
MSSVQGPGAVRGAFLLLALGLVSACAPAAGEPSPTVIDVHATSAAYPWLEAAYDCAPPSTALRLTGPDAAVVSLRLGEPSHLVAPAYQVGLDDLLVVVHPMTSVGPLSRQQVQRIFAGEVTNWKEVGGADTPIQVWTYSRAEDVQAYFAEAIMDGRPVTSLARLAVSAQVMSDSVGTIAGSIGFLPRRWRAGNTKEVLALPSLPVLAIVRNPPQGALKTMLACMQSKSAVAAP